MMTSQLRVWRIAYAVYSIIVAYGYDRLRRLGQRSRPADARIAEIVLGLRRRGIIIIPGFLPEKTCDLLCEEVDRLHRDHNSQVQVYSKGADHRAFAAERASPAIQEFAFHPFLTEIAQAYWHKSVRNAFTLAAHLLAIPGNLGSGEGWHRDSQPIQFKALVYLTDVGPENGPFEILEGSHTVMSVLSNIVKYNHQYGKSRIHENLIKIMLSKEPQKLLVCEGTRGTLILIDSSSIHRGRPIISGERYALTNYYYLERQITPQLFSHFSPLIEKKLS